MRGCEYRRGERSIEEKGDLRGERVIVRRNCRIFVSSRVKMLFSCEIIGRDWIVTRKVKKEEEIFKDIE